MDVHITDLFNSNLILEIYLLYGFNFSDIEKFFLFRLPLLLQSEVLLGGGKRKKKVRVGQRERGVGEQ